VLACSIANRVLFPMNFRLFVDEVGNGDLNGAATDPNVRYLGLTGVLTRQSAHERIIQPCLDDLKAELFNHTPANPVILHRREIVRREGPFAALRDPEKLTRFNEAMLRFYAEFPYLVMTVLIDKKAHLEAYGVWHFDPYHYCMRCLIERYVLYLRSKGWRGDVMIEARYKKADKKLKASFQRTYDEGTENIAPRIVQDHLLSRDIDMKPKIANIAGLQLADGLAHPSARHMRFERDREPQPNDFGAKVVEILIEKKYRRDPRTLKIDGYGRKWLP
jgi:hypothetical protein